MIESKNEASRNLEKALQALEQAKQRVANEKKKQNEKKRKAENHHKYIMGGIIMKYFPGCYQYDEDELNRILSVALQTRECQQIIAKIKSESRESTSTQTLFNNLQVAHTYTQVVMSTHSTHLSEVSDIEKVNVMKKVDEQTSLVMKPTNGLDRF